MTAGAKDPFRWEILISLRDGESLSRDFYVGVTEEGVQCAAIIQARIIIPETKTIVRPWVSSKRRTWRRVLRM
jgi:hypothetical protein